MRAGGRWHGLCCISGVNPLAVSPGPLPQSSTELQTPRLSIVLSTYNRAGLLGAALRTVLEQDPTITPPFEVVVVDNNSTDSTREIVAGFCAGDPRVRYVFEPRQGLSHGRNAGIAHARAPLIAFMDDDLRADPDWVAAIVRAFDEHPSADVVGGRVLPIWPVPPPAWLTPEHWAPLALADHGDTPFPVTAERPICLIEAGGCRRDVFVAVGAFVSDFQRVKDSIGSLEDHDFIIRVLGNGRQGLYVPGIIARAAVQPDRLGRAYHRRWHFGHGHFYALMRSEETDRAGCRTLLGVPVHMYRQALKDVVGWVREAALGSAAKSFLREVRLRFFAGFFLTRSREFLARPLREQRAEIAALLRLPIRPRAAVDASARTGLARTE